MSNKPGTFSSENQPKKRRARGKSQRTKILEAFSRISKTEGDFYDILAHKAINEGDAFSLGELMKRLMPVTKAVAPKVEFDFNEKAKPHEQAARALKAISSGEIPPDIGATFIASIKAMIDIEEYTDLKERIEKLEALIDGETTS